MKANSQLLQQSSIERLKTTLGTLAVRLSLTNSSVGQNGVTTRSGSASPPVGNQLTTLHGEDHYRLLTMPFTGEQCLTYTTTTPKTANQSGQEAVGEQSEPWWQFMEHTNSTSNEGHPGDRLSGHTNSTSNEGHPE